MTEGFGLTIQECIALCDEQGDGSLMKQFGRVEDVAKLLRVHDLKKGLDSDDLELRKSVFGENAVPEPPRRTYLGLVLDSLKDTTMIILCIAAVVSLVISFVEVSVESPCSDFDPHRVRVEQAKSDADYIEAVAIIVAVIVISNVTATNDYTKEKQFRALNEVSRNSLMIQVCRGSRRMEVPVKELVVGDVIYLTQGQKVPVDGLFIDGQNLTCNESALTGEVDSRKKMSGSYMKSGAIVDQGDGRMLALAVGEHTDAGRAITILSAEQDETPLQTKLNRMAEQIGKGGLAFAILTFVSAAIRFAVCRKEAAEPWNAGELKILLDYLILAITIVVVAVPEGLPLAVTISLAYSMTKMMKDQNLVRKLAACETMGGATNICSDKTGTLTENRMTVTEGVLLDTQVATIPDREVVSQTLNLTDKRRPWFDLLLEGLAANTQDASFVQLTKNFIWEVSGNKTECALLVLCSDLGGSFEAIRDVAWKHQLRTINFSSDRKCMSTVLEGSSPNTWRVHCKGAGEIVLALCSTMVAEDGSVEQITPTKRAELTQTLKSLTERGLRTLCLGTKAMPAGLMVDVAEESDLERDLTLLAIVGIKDPVRSAVPTAVKMCRSAGITVRMVTGDNIDTAKHIARECGILDKEGLAMEGSEFRNMSREDIVPLLPRLQVLARSKPTDKFLLVKLLKDLGEVVAVTGDGTNDAPALKEADVGLAMGIAGTDVAIKAADIVILDDNFASIVRAVLWGRNVYDSIRKFLQFQLTVNVTALIIAYVGAVVDSRSPVTPVQLLWINLIMDTMAALALATETPSPALLQRKPHGRFDSLISPRMALNVVGHAVVQVAVLLFMLYRGESLYLTYIEDEAERREVNYSLIFNAFVFLQVFNEINARELGTRKNVFHGMFSNKMFVGVIVVTVIVQALLVEFGGQAMETVALSPAEFFASLAVGAIGLPCGFLLKLIPVPEWHAEPKAPPAPATETAPAGHVVKTAQRPQSLEMESKSSQHTAIDSAVP
eukprot:c21009_g1_i1.p1 GENE.c21009_g1_i1~~c21009_g1_i1.p1  ORF type:complete len:1007 (+),score=241.13 c21009_g1_i1:83-3103(+)